MAGEIAIKPNMKLTKRVLFVTISQFNLNRKSLK